MATQLEERIRTEHRVEPREGNPVGTYFVVSILMVIVVLIGMYFVVTHMNEVENTSPVITEGATGVDNPARQSR